MNNKVISPWNKWNPKEYIEEFYPTELAADEYETIAFLSMFAKKIVRPGKLLEFGCGPTLRSIFPFVRYVSEIHMSDFLQSNLTIVTKWVNSKNDGYNYDKYISKTLEFEGTVAPTKNNVELIKRETKKKITKFLKADASLQNPLGKRARESYQTVISCYCADSATNNHTDFELYIRNIASLVKPGGSLVLACLRKARYYKVGKNYFPSANVDEHLLYKILALDFLPETITIKVKRVPAHKEQGYTSILLAYATKIN